MHACELTEAATTNAFALPLPNVKVTGTLPQRVRVDRSVRPHRASDTSAGPVPTLDDGYSEGMPSSPRLDRGPQLRARQLGRPVRAN